jgi:chorismate--pyruvate lyase
VHNQILRYPRRPLKIDSQQYFHFIRFNKNDMNRSNARINPPWKKPHCLLRSSFPETIWSWLLDPSSLTRRLQETCAGQFKVLLLNQGWARPYHEEAHMLGLRARTYANVREVYLLCHGQPCVFARTVIPARTLSGKYRRLTRLGNRSLGAVLFADKSMRRSALEITCIFPGQQLFERAVRELRNTPQLIWGRRSLFHLAGKPLLLSEIFLRDMRKGVQHK